MIVGNAARPASLDVTTAEPSPTDAQTLGITRRIAVPGGRLSEIRAMETPAATLVTAFSVPSKLGEISSITCLTSQGLTAAMMRSLVSAGSWFDEGVRRPASR